MIEVITKTGEKGIISSFKLTEVKQKEVAQTILELERIKKKLLEIEFKPKQEGK